LAYQPHDAATVGGGDPSSAELRGWIERGGVSEALANLGVDLPHAAIRSLQE
jgi:hypothetical protein